MMIKMDMALKQKAKKMIYGTESIIDKNCNIEKY